MTDQEITALAREYAEEITKGNLPANKEVPEYIIKTIAKEATTTLNWLLRRYALVEKEKVRKEHEDCYRQYLAAGNARPLRQQYFFGRCFALECLFPDLGKEVDND